MLNKIKLFLLVQVIFTFNLFAVDLEFENIFKSKNIEGTIVIESLNTKKVYIHNDKRANMPLSPASTFKIPHTLIALNEGIVNANSIIFWDKTDKKDTVVISTHGIIKKTDKTPKIEIERAESLRVKYFNEKK